MTVLKLVLFVLSLSLSQFSIAQNSLQVMSFNVLRSSSPKTKEMETLVENLRQRKLGIPEIILLQEIVHREGGKNSDAHFLASKIDYNIVSATKGGLITASEGGAILSKYPVKRSEKLVMGSFPVLDSYRLAVFADIEIPHLGLVRVINVHLAYNPAWHRTRKKQVKKILKKLAEWEKEEAADLIIFGGDFNALKNSKALKLLEKDFIDNNNHNSHTFPGDKRRIDHIFIKNVNTQLNFVSEEVLDELMDLSDHLPLVHSYTY